MVRVDAEDDTYGVLQHVSCGIGNDNDNHRFVCHTELKAENEGMGNRGVPHTNANTSTQRLIKARALHEEILNTRNVLKIEVHIHILPSIPFRQQ